MPVSSPTSGRGAAPRRRAGALLEPEELDPLAHRGRLVLQRLGGVGVLLHQGGVLLRHLVELGERLVDLIEPGRLLVAGIGGRSLISLAACEERCARLRTSEATTAKPRPASPARAASTAALSASRLVWPAISSITPMMSAILPEDSSIRDIAATACVTTWPPRSATVQVAWVSSLACWA